jgi:hypothetical protein
MEKKKLEKQKERAEYLEQERKKRLEKYKKLLKNKEEIELENEEMRKLILAEQKEILSRGVNKDSVSNNKRIEAGDKIVKEQLCYVENMSAFKRRMDQIQSASIMKKSPEERYNMYKEMKREEAERKKKELEDKMQK